MTAKKSGKRLAFDPDRSISHTNKRPPTEPPGPINKGGRPTKYRPEFCQEIIEHMRQGFSVESFPAALYEKHRIMIGKTSIYEWEEVHEEFSNAIKAGRALSQKFYEQMARSGMAGNLQRVVSEKPVIVNGKAVLGDDGRPLTQKEYEPASFNSSAWIFTMKNRFQWRDRLEHSGEIKGANPVGDALIRILADPGLAAAAKQIAEKLVEDEE